MRACAIAFVLSFVQPASAALVYYDGFDYTVADRVIGQTNATYSETWTDPTAPVQPTGAADTQRISAGNVDFPGLPTATGQRLTVPRDVQSNIARINLPGRPYNTSVGTPSAFFSFTMQLLNVNSAVLDGTGTGQAGSTAQQQGGFIAGLSSGAGTGGMSGAGVYAGQVRIRREVAAGGVQTGRFQLGIHKNNVAPGAAEIVWATSQAFGLNEPVFLVAEYQFNDATTSDDVTRLWVNPVPGTLPAPSAISSGGTDVSPASLNSFWFRSDTTSPGDFVVDELRIGTSFENVTPIPEPASFAVAAFAALFVIQYHYRFRWT
jgi:hypothetical protein